MRHASEPPSPSVTVMLTHGSDSAPPARGAQRLFALGPRRIVLEGRPGSGAGPLIITAVRPRAVTEDAGTAPQQAPQSPATLLSHWTIGSPSCASPEV